MISGLAAALMAGLVVAAPPQPARPVAVRRLVLIAGANRGGDERPVLKYALSDADRFDRIMQTIGGADPADVVILKQPRVGELDAALEALKQRTAAARRSAAAGTTVRTEAFFYYSGHADEKGLLLGNDRLSYLTLRERLEAVPADVRIGILDACASGAITRPKGGKIRSPFTVDGSSDMRGYAFLASSSADESAQESDRLGGSFFTHYLLSGMRGAADFSGDGRVTLNEAYQFAFNETLSRTVGTRGGPQHPVYDITMSGTGEVVLTDLRQMSAGFAVAAPVDGRFYVLDERKRLVVEFYKPVGRKVDIGLEPGVYDVRYEKEPKALQGRLEIKEGPHQQIDVATFGPARLEFTRLRGVDTSSDFLLNGRQMVAVSFGMWSGPPAPVASPAAGVTGSATGAMSRVSAGRLTASAEYLRFVRDDLALGAGLHAIVDSADSTFARDALSVRSRVGLTVPVIVRWNPIRSFSSWRAAEPYLRGSFGPLIATRSAWRTVGGNTVTETTVNATVGGSAGIGADIRIGRSWTAGMSASYLYSGEIKEPGLEPSRFSGWEVRFGVGILFGAARPARR